MDARIMKGTFAARKQYEDPYSQEIETGSWTVWIAGTEMILCPSESPPTDIIHEL